MRISCDNVQAAGKHYCPIAIGNGDLGLQIDYEGAMGAPHSSGVKGIAHVSNIWNTMIMTPRIRRAGYRYDSVNMGLIPFGCYEQELAGSGAVQRWTQTLDVTRGLVECVCSYENGMTVESTVFCHLERNVIAVRKRITGGGSVDFTLRYSLGEVKRMRVVHANGRFAFDVDSGQYQGCIAVRSPELPMVGEGVFRGEAREVTFFIALDDADIEWSRNQSFDELLASHTSAWAAYWAESYIEIPHRRLQEVYYTSQYFLRTISTKWSIPIGLFETHWHGKFFAFDEHFSASALMGSGHLKQARKIPEFRHTCLPRALRRASDPQNGAARFQWETLEDGSEGCPSLFSIEHIFHMASIASECFDYYVYSGDTAFLRDTGYPVIKACAQFFDLMATAHRADGALIIGRCTDLERLGGGRENAFMTTCGAITTFDAALRSARLLGLDAEMIERWVKLSADLKTGLPHDGEKYIPHPGCEQKSIAVYSGIYPYPALPLDDPLQLAAIKDFDAGGDAFGNMYRQGKGLCTWYAAWKAVIRARLGDAATACTLLERAAEETGCFSEVFEIYELSHNPWFSTAAGTVIQAVNDMLLQVNRDGELRLAPAVPESWKDYSFKLQGAGGVMVEAEAVNGQLRRIL